MSQHKREIAVVGGGLAGYCAAIGFAAQGFETTLLAPKPLREDRRSTALIGSSVAFLDRIGVLERIMRAGAALTRMRIVDDTGRLLRAPTVEFDAAEIGIPAFGYNVLNLDLASILADRAGELGERLAVIDTGATGIAIEPDAVDVTLANGDSLRASLVVGADGRRSVVRGGAGIRSRDWSYPQTAIVLNFEHEVDHADLSTEFHTPTGPFTQVPLPGRRSSLVWVERPEIAELVVDLAPERLATMIEERMHSILGKVEVDGPVQAFPLRGSVAQRQTAPRVALIGEAAHVFPPIGAQGLNLGLRDAAAIVEAATTARDDPGRQSALLRFETRRRTDVLSRTAGVDALNRSLLSDFLPVQALRSAGLAAMSALPLLRRFAMREGAAPGAGLFGLPEAVRAGFSSRP
ncbi:UbiH/UbiF family hydroxylase [Aureimonas leprariae]|uniref:UbiH/UbiF family hydroxylase n=1 Tax=Plantimonas leprariae TaxID=2615207 RepID=UPI00192A6709|nr:UbiH/UbiF family hydroxylase [Aureimonas leprariae]